MLEKDKKSLTDEFANNVEDRYNKKTAGQD
jgi:hypothetical protein